MSFFEFGCAGSLCRKDVNILEELSQIKNEDRFKAVVMYLAGLFSENASIEFLNTCKHLCRNFLDLLDNQDREQSIQNTLKSIIAYPMTETKKIIVTTETVEAVRGERKIFKRNRHGEISGWEKVNLLVDAMVTSSSKLRNTKLTNVCFPYVQKWSDYQRAVNLMELQDCDTDMKFEVLDFSVLETATMVSIIKAANQWSIRKTSRESQNAALRNSLRLSIYSSCFY